MALRPLICPICHGQIDHFDESAKIGQCPYCKTVIQDVQERQSAFAVNSQGAVKVTESDFEIKGGVLVKYHGENQKAAVLENVVSIGREAFLG